MADGKKLTRLLVEDEVLIRMNTADMLADLGHVVIEAGSGEKALQLFETQPVDVVITDLGLPGMAGEALAALLRSRKPDIGIVLATGSDHGADELGLPGAIVLRKPYDEVAVAAALGALGQPA